LLRGVTTRQKVFRLTTPERIPEARQPSLVIDVKKTLKN
jgi:hypothetical protein